MARRGRKRNPDSKRNQTTRAGQGRIADKGTRELQMKKHRLGIPETVSLDFPLDILLARNVISQEQHTAGCRFAGLSWRVYGFPCGSSEGVYQRMVAGNLDPDFTPRRAGGDGDGTSDQEKADRHVAVTLHAMTMALRRRGNRHLLDVVANIAQYLRMPGYLLAAANRRAPTAAQLKEMALLQEGLTILADLTTSRHPVAAE
jgi:hypothetical protein